MAGQNPAPSTSWYYRAETREVGPVTSNRLRQLARQAKLADDDLVRMGRTGDWVPAASLEWLETKPRTTAAASEEHEGEAPESAPPSAMRLLADSLLQGVQNCYIAAQRAVRGSLYLIRQIAAFAVLIAIAGGLMQIARDAGLLDWSMPVNALATVQELGDDVKRLRETKASDDEWNALSAKGKHLLPAVVKDLERTAGADNRMAQMLLWSARDCLPQMFTDARTEPSAAERRYDEYMQNVALLQQGLPIYDRPAAPGANVQRPQGSDDGPLNRAMVVAILVADMAIIVWLIHLWRRRSRANA